MIDRAFEEIFAAPLECPAWLPDRPYRKKVVQRFPYMIFFRVADDEVIVTAVAHARRRPGYWAERRDG